MRGGMEAVYDDVPVPLGFGQFAPTRPARGPMFSARTTAKLAGESRPAVIEEAELYGVASPQSAAKRGPNASNNGDSNYVFEVRSFITEKVPVWDVWARQGSAS